MFRSKKNNETKQYIHKVLFFMHDPEIIENAIDFCQKVKEKDIKDSEDLKARIKKEGLQIKRINNNNFFEKNDTIITQLSFLKLEYEYTKKLSDNLPNNVVKINILNNNYQNSSKLTKKSQNNNNLISNPQNSSKLITNPQNNLSSKLTKKSQNNSKLITNPQNSSNSTEKSQNNLSDKVRNNLSSKAQNNSKLITNPQNSSNSTEKSQNGGNSNNLTKNTRMNKKNYTIKSKILKYKDSILKYLIKYKLKNEGEDLDISMQLMENIMKNDGIKNSINENFKKNNIEDILKELNHHNPYIKYCIILDVEKPTSRFSTGSIIRRRMLTQKGGDLVLGKLSTKRSEVPGIFMPIVFIIAIPFIIIASIIMVGEYVNESVLRPGAKIVYDSTVRKSARYMSRLIEEKYGEKIINEQDLRYLIGAIKNVYNHGKLMLDCINKLNMLNDESKKKKQSKNKIKDLQKDINEDKKKNPLRYQYVEILKKYRNLSNLDVSEITNMQNLFKDFIFFDEFDGDSITAYKKITGYSNIDLNITRWNVYNVKDMSEMFYNCETLKQDLSLWNVYNVKHMNYIFCNSGYSEKITTYNKVRNSYKNIGTRKRRITDLVAKSVAKNWFDKLSSDYIGSNCYLTELEHLYETR